MNYVSVMFKGRNGTGTIGLSMPNLSLGALRAKVVHVQQVFADISDGTVTIADATDSFDAEIVSGNITQNTGNDWSDVLFLAVMQIP